MHRPLLPYLVPFFVPRSARYLGDQRASYNQELRFALRVAEPGGGGARPSVEDIVVEGGGAKTTRISLSITDQGNPSPTDEVGARVLWLLLLLLVVAWW